MRTSITSMITATPRVHIEAGMGARPTMASRTAATRTSQSRHSMAVCTAENDGGLIETLGGDAGATGAERTTASGGWALTIAGRSPDAGFAAMVGNGRFSQGIVASVGAAGGLTGAVDSQADVEEGSPEVARDGDGWLAG